MTPDARGTNQQVKVAPLADSVALPDRLITEGKSSSRAYGVARAIQHERRRRAAEHDAELYRAHPEVVGPHQEEWDRARQFPNLEE